MANDTILLVDDDPALLACLRELFQEMGYGVATATDGAEAIQFLASAPPPRMILLDLMMPVVSGAEVLSWMRGPAAPPHVAQIPVVILSFCAESPGAGGERSGSLGASATLSKPVEVGHLLSVVEAVCGRAAR